MDYLKYTLPWGPCTGETREGWNALRKRLRPLIVDNMAMSSAPSYELCCTAPLFLCLPCSRPKRAIVMSMGGNDFLWLPFPFVHEALSKIGLDAPLQYMRCFLQQTSVFSPNLNVIFIPDTVINENLCCSEAYIEYCAHLRDLASVRNCRVRVCVVVHNPLFPHRKKFLTALDTVVEMFVGTRIECLFQTSQKSTRIYEDEILIIFP